MFLGGVVLIRQVRQPSGPPPSFQKAIRPHEPRRLPAPVLESKETTLIIFYFLYCSTFCINLNFFFSASNILICKLNNPMDSEPEDYLKTQGIL